MTGLMEEYGIDPDEIPDGPNYDLPDGVYRFDIGRGFIWESDEGDRRSFVIEYLLDDEEEHSGSKSEWFNLPLDPTNVTEDEQNKLSFLKQRFLSLGFPRDQIGKVAPEDVEGLTGTLTLLTVAGKGRNAGRSFQNVRNVTIDAEPEPVEVPAPARPAARTASVKKAPTNPFAKK